MLLPTKLYGVIGWPLAQTLSPLIHNIGFQKYGLPAVYLAWPVEPEQLETFLSGLAVYQTCGCSVTIPHKLAVIPYLARISNAATLAGAVNTLYFENGALCGDNTDVGGFLAPLRKLSRKFASALLLGAGGAAHAVAAGLTILGCANVTITSPGNQRQYPLAEKFGYAAIPWQERYNAPYELLINATPLGMTGKHPEQSAYDFTRGPRVEAGVAYDLVYNPLHTRFLAEARAAGRACINGLDMFFNQANAQFKLWTGRDLPEMARTALEEALAK